MKATELMIGDWLNVSKLNKPVRVGAVYRTMIVPNPDDDDVHASIGDEYLEPIKLTPEILEKNGWKHEFDKTDYMVKYDLGKEGKNCWMMWAIKEHNLDIQRQDENLDMYNLKVSRVVIPCDYVHELQHALKLCEIKKEIEL